MSKIIPIKINIPISPYLPSNMSLGHCPSSVREWCQYKYPEQPRMYSIFPCYGRSAQKTQSGMRTYISSIGNNTICISQLLLEWGADIYIKNKVSKTAMELIRNSDLKTFLEGNVLMVQLMYIIEVVLVLLSPIPLARTSQLRLR